MHGAPAVSYPTGRRGWALVLAAVPWSLAACVTIAWTAVAPAAGTRQAAVAALLAALAVALIAGWRRLPEGDLHWDGARWTVTLAGAAPTQGRVACALDLQRAMVLRWVPVAGPARWMLADAAGDPPRWDDLRRAVYSRASTEVPPGPAPSPAEP